ncbi:MAG: hypothetical protein ACI4TJ_02535 [Candidatus Cryptobacteroides sp.]
MTKDNDLEKLFASAVREFDDNGRFLEQLDQKLEKVEYVKRIQQEQRQAWRTNVVLTLVSGALSLLAAFLLFPLLPSDFQILQAISGINLYIPIKAKLLSIMLIVALTYSLVFSIRSIRRDLAGHQTI